MTIELVQIFGGGLRDLPGPRGRIMRSGIKKTPIDGPVALTRTGLPGDESSYYSRAAGDTALHLYAREHYSALSEAAGRPIECPGFGENLSITGYLEADMRIGDELRIGTALLRITQPVIRCSRPGTLAGEKRLLSWVNAGCRIGCYLAVVETGEIAPGIPVELVRRGDPDMTVSALHWLWQTGLATDATARALSHPLLSDKWKADLRKRLG